MAEAWWTMFPRYAHRRGHRLVLYADRRWRWAATGRFVPGGRRPLDRDPPCVACGLPPTPEGYDACLGHIPGARAACCGHGVKEPYVSWGAGDVERGDEVLRFRRCTASCGSWSPPAASGCDHRPA